jgi:hypothetical protein
MHSALWLTQQHLANSQQLWAHLAKSHQSRVTLAMKPQASIYKLQQVFMFLAVGCHLAHALSPQSRQYGMLSPHSMPCNLPAMCHRLTSQFEFTQRMPLLHCSISASHHTPATCSKHLGPFESNQQHVWHTATRQHQCRPSCIRTATQTRQQQLHQCPASTLPHVYLLQACHSNPLSTAAHKLHADSLGQRPWQAYCRTTATWHAQHM